MQISAQVKLIAITGLALFAMFFGAGNIIFPLKLGSTSGEFVWPALGAFLISAVGVPFLGLFAVSLYEGDYWKFFQRFGKVFAFVIVTFLVLIIGPLFAGPRTEIVTYSTLLPVLPSFLKNAYAFDLLYFSIAFVLVCNQSRIVDIIGWILSPVKIITFSILVALGVYTMGPVVPTVATASQTFNNGFMMGYGTMDLLPTFFFCAIAYKNIVNKCQLIGVVSQRSIIRITLLSCLVGACLIAAIYTGLVFAASSHAQELQNIPTEALIGKISQVILGQYGSAFVAVCVSFACLATAAAVIEVTTEYFHNTLFRGKVPRLACIIFSLIVMYMMAILGFDGIMKIAVPILNVIYPLLILLCVINIAYKVMPRKSYCLSGVDTASKAKEVA
jgi:LIVCS family branched-chain amino acid:cation transporter